MKINKSFLLLLISTPIFCDVDATRYQENAKQWTSQFVINDDGSLRITPADLHLFLNLTYFSFLRSDATLRAQEVALPALRAAWEGWQNIAQTRLNPSVDLPFDAHTTTNAAVFTQFIEAQKYHRIVGVTYSNAIEIIIGAILTSPQSPYAVERLRQESRVVIADILMNIKQQITLLTSCAQELLRNDDMRSSFKESLLAFLPPFALTSFLKIESCYNLASEKSWELLDKLQGLSTLIYQTIEEERASFYAAHYNELIKIFQKQKLKASYSTIAFNERGLIPPSARTQALPTKLV